MTNSLNFPEHTPDKTGYYVVKYLNKDHNEIYYKAIIWDGKIVRGGGLKAGQVGETT